MIKKISLYLATIILSSLPHLKTDTPYEVLGIREDATLEAATQARRRLALHWHPDKHPNNAEQANDMIRQINNAFDKIKEERDLNEDFHQSINKISLYSKIALNSIQTYLQLNSFEAGAIHEESVFILSNWNDIKNHLNNRNELVEFFNSGSNTAHFKNIIRRSILFNLSQYLTFFPFARHITTIKARFEDVNDNQPRLHINMLVKWQEIITEMIFDSLGIAACEKLLSKRATILADLIMENHAKIEKLHSEYMEAEKNNDELALDCATSEIAQIVAQSHKSLYVEIKELITSLKVGNKLQSLIAKAALTSAGMYIASNMGNFGRLFNGAVNNIVAQNINQQPGFLRAP